MMLKHDIHHTFLAPKPRWGYIGHRGLAAVAPENTLASFEAAAHAGLNWIEFDLRLTSDKALVIFHDDELNRTTNGSGLIHESPWKYLKKLDAGSWFHPYFHCETIPLFKDILPKLLHMDFFLNIELKTPLNASSEHTKNLVLQLIEILKMAWPKNKPLPLISSFDWSLLPSFRQIFPDIPLGYLSDVVDLAMVETIAQQNNCALHCDYQALNPDIIEKANALSLPILAYTVNDHVLADQLISQGVFGIFTDHYVKIENSEKSA